MTITVVLDAAAFDVLDSHRSIAHVVAACATADAAIVLTANPGDIAALATAVPGTRIVTRDPSFPL